MLRFLALLASSTLCLGSQDLGSGSSGFVADRSYYSRWHDNLDGYWRNSISNHFDKNHHNNNNNDYVYYNEETDAECVDQDETSPQTKPNIIFVLGDDWGYDDIGYHNRRKKTPYMNWLARKGLRLEQSYATAWCSPSRAALLTGKYPHSIQRQRWVLHLQSLTGLKTDEKLLPEYLKERGYDTHMLGKWHLGFCNPAYLPTNRGFDTQYGFMNSQIWNYVKTNQLPPYPYDWFLNDTSIAGPDEILPFSGDLLQTRANELITEAASRADPFFMYLALPHVHWPVEAPLEFTDKYWWEQDDEQRNHFAMLSHMDAMIGSIVKTLKETGQYDNSILVVMGDNGGYSVQWSWLPFQGTGSNYPLRGAKGNNQEGGTRVPTFVHSPLLKKRGITNKMTHITDWLPTLLRASGLSKSEVAALEIDGVDQYDALFRGCPAARDEFTYAFQGNLLNASDPNSGYPVGAVRIGKYKISNIDEPVDIPITPRNAFLTPLLPPFVNFTIYDLSTDPFEENNLLDILPQDTVQQLKARFFALAQQQLGPEEPPLFTPFPQDTVTELGVLRTDFCNLDGTRVDPPPTTSTA